MIGFLQSTCRHLDLESNTTIVHGDAFLAGAAQLSAPDDDTPWVVFLCPPYALWDSMLAELKGLMARFTEQPLSGASWLRRPRRNSMLSVARGNWDFREYGNTRLGFIESEPILWFADVNALEKNGGL